MDDKSYYYFNFIKSFYKIRFFDLKYESMILNVMT